MLKNDLSITRLEANLDAKIERHFDTLDTDPDVLAQLLSDKRSPNTRRAYEKDVGDFLKTMTGKPACPDSVLEFLHLEERQAVSVVLKYKAKLIDKGLKEATVNRRLAAIKSLVEMGRKLGVCHYALGDIKGEKVAKYRDTTGIDAGTFERLLQQCDRGELAGKRDYALLRLLWGNALRRNEVSQLSVRVQGATSAPELLQALAFGAIDPSQKFLLIDKIISRGKRVPVVIKKKGPANTTRPKPII